MIPVRSVHGEGYILYVTDGGGFENDCYTVVLCDSGNIKHYNSQQITVHPNLTYEIKNKQ